MKISGFLCCTSILYIILALVPCQGFARKIYEPGKFLDKTITQMSDQELENAIRRAGKEVCFWREGSHKQNLYKMALDELMKDVKRRELWAKKWYMFNKKFDNPKEVYKYQEEFFKYIRMEVTCYKALHPGKSALKMTADDIYDIFKKDGFIANLDRFTFAKNLAMKAFEKNFIRLMKDQGVPESLAQEQWQIISDTKKIKNAAELFSKEKQTVLQNLLKDELSKDIYQFTSNKKTFRFRNLIGKKVNSLLNTVQVSTIFYRFYIYTQTNQTDLILQCRKLRKMGLSDSEIVAFFNDPEKRKLLKGRILASQKKEQDLIKLAAHKEVMEEISRSLQLDRAKRRIAEARGIKPSNVNDEDAEKFLNDKSFKKAIERKIERLFAARHKVGRALGYAYYKVPYSLANRYLENKKYRSIIEQRCKELEKGRKELARLTGRSQYDVSYKEARKYLYDSAYRVSVTKSALSRISTKPKKSKISTSGIVNVISGESFYDIVKGSSKPVIVGFDATWCNACKRPTLENLARKYGKNFLFVRLVLDSNPDDKTGATIARRYGIRSLPSYVMLNKAQVVKKFPGGTSEEMLEASITEFLEDQNTAENERLDHVVNIVNSVADSIPPSDVTVNNHTVGEISRPENPPVGIEGLKNDPTFKKFMGEKDR